MIRKDLCEVVTFNQSGKGWVGVSHGETGVGKKTLGEVREGCDAGHGEGRGGETKPEKWGGLL